MKYFAIFSGICGGILPLIYLIYNVFAQNYGAEPSKTILHFLGDWSIYFVLLAILSSIITKFCKSQQRLKKSSKILGKIFGLYALPYALLHISSYVVFEQGGDIKSTLSEILLRIYLFLGFWALLGLLVLGFFSFFFHKYFYYFSSLSYVAGLLASIHYLLGQKIPSIVSYIFFIIFFTLLCAKLLSKNSKKDFK